MSYPSWPVSRALVVGLVCASVALLGQASAADAASSTPTHVGGAHVKSTSTDAAKRAALRQARTSRRVSRSAQVGSSSTAVSRLALAAGSASVRKADPTPPATTTPALGTLGTSGVVSLSATSEAAFVLFEVDGSPVDGQTGPTPVAVTTGTASATYTTWGNANGTDHSVTAADCSTADPASCNPVGAQADFVVTNDDPAITGPADGASVTGGFTVTATSPGGGVQFQIDGVRKGFVSTSPYSFSYTGSALTAGPHTVSVVECSATESQCDGPTASITITSNSLHPALSKATPAVFSPNGDRYKDTASVSYSLPDRETASIAVLTAGGTSVRTAALGTLTGKHTWTWNGRTTAGKVAASGRYTIRLSTSAERNGATVRGQVSTTVTVDLRAPALTSLKYPTSIYPRHDGYRDTFPVTFRSNEGIVASLVILNARHKVVRTISVSHAAGAVSIVWNGYDAHKHLLAAGTYGWYLSWRDSAGNKAHSAARHVGLSLRSLVTKHVTINKNGDSYWTAGGSDTDCSEARTDLSEYTHGVWLANVCDVDSDGVQVAAAFYHVTLPAAVSYSRVSVTVGGFTISPPTTMVVGYGKKGGTSDYAIGPRYRITDGDEAYWGIGGINPTGLMSSKHVMNVAINVDNIDGGGDFDIATVRFVVTYKVLK